MATAVRKQTAIAVILALAIGAFGVGIAENLLRTPVSFDHQENQPPNSGAEAVRRRLDGC